MGKSIQAKLLTDKLNLQGLKTEYLKYPIYDLEPSGPILNNFLRGGNTYNLSRRDAQFMYAMNRTQYEEKLLQKLQAGINIIAEDYVGTGLSWGIGSGVDEEFLRNANKHLLKEDLAFLFDGERFRQAAEKNHKHESDDELTNKVRQTHQRLGEEFGWIKINANQTIDEIHSLLWNKVIELIQPQKAEEQKIIPASADLKPENLWGQAVNEPKKQTGDSSIDFTKSNFKVIREIEKEKIINKSSDDLTSNNLIVERLSPNAKLPIRPHEHDAGLDLFSLDYYSLAPGERTIARTGIKLAIPTGCVGLVWDKGGLAKEGLHTMAGVIDAGYRGEILINIINLGQTIAQIAHGQKIAQLLIQKIELPKIIEGKIEDETTRGEGRFGSTGLF